MPEGARKERSVLTLEQAAAALEMSPESIRRRIVKGAIKARFDRGSPQKGWIIERSEYVRYLRSIGEDERAADVERGFLPN